MSDTAIDWHAVVQRMAEGDAAAFFKVSQLVTQVLRGMRAYDFQQEWSDLIQEVALATLTAVREDRIESRDAVGAFVRQITRNKFSDRLRRQEDRKEKATMEIEDAPRFELRDASIDPDPVAVVDIRRGLDALPTQQRNLILAVYGERKTYEEAAAKLGIPLGTVKRNLREGLDPREDTLPPRFLAEPIPDGPAAGTTVDIRRMVDDYYAEKGWK